MVGGWGQQWTDFQLFFFSFEKHWILPKDHFKTHLFFKIFGWWRDPSQLGSWSEGCVKPIKLSIEAYLVFFKPFP